MENEDYFRIGRASELKSIKDRIIYRLLEILPGAVSWGALLFAVITSWKIPLLAAIFIISFSIFWFFRTIYFSFHLWTGYKKMGENEKINWLERLNSLPVDDYNEQGARYIGRTARYRLPNVESWRNLYHLVVIPMYKEPLEIVRDTFRCIEKSNYPKEKMIVVLGCEEKTRDFAEGVAKEIEKEFAPKFFKILITWHPVNLPDELAGKGSNETWAAKKAKELIIDPLGVPYENIIFSSFDADTCIFPNYFACLTYNYLTSENPTRSSFQPVPLFINNIWQAPVVSRIFSFSSTFWHTINQERPEKLITFSSHSMSFKALAEVGFKQTNIVSDDSRIFWQCFLKYDGNYQAKPLYYPISMDANVSKNLFRTMINIYKQQRRWAYGVADIPYFLFGFLKKKKIPLSRKIGLGWELIEGHFCWATASILIFLMGWLPLFLGGGQFTQTVFSYNLPKIISRIMTFSMIGLVLSAYLSFLLLPPKPPEYGRFKYVILAVSWIFFPIIMIFFTSFPALDAQTRLMLGKYMGFWVTEKVRK